MNPDKIDETSRQNGINNKWVSWLIPVIFCCVSLLFFFAHNYPKPLGNDPKTYATLIDNGIIHDWHSSLFIYEGQVLKSFVSLLGVSLSGEDILCVLFCLEIIACFITSYFLCEKLFSRNKYKPLFLFILDTVIFFIASFMSPLYYLDFPGLCLMLIAFTLSLYIRNCSAGQRNCCFFFLFIVIVHIISYRKPFVLITPFILLYSLTSAYRIKRNYAVAISLALSVGAYFLPNSVLRFHTRYEVTYPAVPMLQSDIFIAGVLDNDMSAIRRLDENLPQSGWVVTFPDWCKRIGAQYSKYNIRNEDEWTILKNAWLAEWGKHSKEMILARCIQIVQFLNGGELPSPFVEALRKTRPWIPSTGKKTSEYQWPVNGKIAKGEAWGVNCAIVASAVLSACAFCLCKQSRNRMLFLYIASIAIMGTIAYTSVCVPTADLRYKTTPFFFAVLSIIYSGSYIIVQKADKSTIGEVSTEKECHESR